MREIEDLGKKISLLDCTIRDGGNLNASRFDVETVRAVYNACADAGLEAVELGNKNNMLSREDFGRWRFCEEADLREVVGDSPRDIKISVLADASKCDVSKFPPKCESLADIVRCAFYFDRLDEAAAIADECSRLGYSTALCMMASSTLDDAQISDALARFSESLADAVYVMDSFGGLLPNRAAELVSKYKKALPGKLIGIHVHDNLSCAFANTLAGILAGADIADCTIAGLGKGAGNCRTELLAGAFGKKYDIRPVLQAAQDYIEPLRKTLRWGFEDAYMLTGLAGVNPRPASEFIKNGGGIVTLCDELFK